MSELTLRPGRYQLRVAAGGPTGTAGSVAYDLEVPDFTRGPLVMSGVAVSSRRTNEVANRVRTRLPAPPSARREFTAEDDVLSVYAEAYPNGRGMPANTIAMTVGLRDRDNRVVETADARRVLSDGRDANPRFVAELPLKDLPAGPYVL